MYQDKLDNSDSSYETSDESMNQSVTDSNDQVSKHIDALISELQNLGSSDRGGNHSRSTSEGRKHELTMESIRWCMNKQFEQARYDKLDELVKKERQMCSNLQVRLMILKI